MSITKFINILIAIILLHSCGMSSQPFTSKRSKNNKSLYESGAKGEKRRPVENVEYIRKAKLNIENQEYDEDDEDEEGGAQYDLNSRYKKMYEEMLNNDKKRKKQRMLKGGNRKIFDNYKTPQNQTKIETNKQNISRSTDQDKILKEIESLRRRIESLSAKDCSIDNSESKKLQNYLEQKTSGSDQIIEKTLPNKISIEEGGSCLLPE